MTFVHNKMAILGIRLCFSAYLIVTLLTSWSAPPFLAAIGVCVAVTHCILSYGFKDALIFFLLTNIIGLSMENLSVATGWPFGHYYFAFGANFPHIGEIPSLVGLVWFGMGYMSWRVASFILGDVTRQIGVAAQMRVRLMYLVALPLVAAFVMTQWDLAMDAPSSTLAHAWIWLDGGAFYGVPPSNFIGWVITSWLFYQAFALYLFWAGEDSSLQKAPPQSLSWKFVPVLIYAAASLTYLTPFFIAEPGLVADLSGRLWRIEDIFSASALIALFAVTPTALLAAFHLVREAAPTLGTKPR